MSDDAPASTAPASTGSTAATRRRAGPLALAVVLLAAVGVATAVFPGNAPPLPGVVRDPAPTVDGLVFVDYDDDPAGTETTLTPPDGGVTLAYFGFLSCPDVCPTTLADIRVALQGLDRPQDVTVAFVTVDPGRDEGSEIRDYLQLFYPDLDNRTASLRADGPTPLDAVTDRLGLYVEIEEHEPGDEDYDVGHSAVTYVVDDTGTVVRELPFGATPDEFRRVIRAALED